MDQGSSKSSLPDGDSALFKTPASRFTLTPDEIKHVVAHPYFPGSLVADRYRVEREIGTGGVCTVYLVSDTSRSGARAALKVITGEANPVHLEMFRNEFRILVQLDHKNLLHVFDFGVLPKVKGFFYTAEYVEGKNFLAAAADAGEDTLIDYLVQACRALEYVHTRGYVHYDVKPANLLIDHEDNVKLTDFGLSAFAGRGLGKRIRGTPAYTAPEVISGVDVSHRADLYSLGVTMYEIITGKLPFRGKDMQELFSSIITLTPTPVRQIRPDIPEYLDRIILKLIAKNPADRYENANAVIKALAEARGIEIDLQPETTTEAYLKLPPLCGREKEMKTVRSSLNELGKGRAGRIVIEGSKGMGCSRLLREIHFEAQLCGYKTALSSASAPDLFEQLCRQIDTKQSIRQLQEYQDNSEPELDIEALLPSDYLANIVKVAEKKPVVLNIDDMQQASASEIDLIERLSLLLNGSDTPSLLLVTARGNTDHIKPDEVPGDVHLRLKSLTKKEIGKVITGMFSSIPAPELFVSRLAEATGGVPLAVAEMVRMLVTSGEISVIEGKWRFRGGVEPFEIPHSLEEFYLNQIKALPRHQHNIALNLSLLGRPAKMAEVSSFHDEPAKNIAAILGELERREIIHRVAGRVEIANEGLRNALFSTRSPATLKRRHKLLAEKLLKRRSGKTNRLEIAGHFIRGGKREKGLRQGLMAIKSGEVDNDRYGSIPILELMRKVSKNAAPANRAEVLFALARAIFELKDPDTVLGVIKEYFSISQPKKSSRHDAGMQSYAAECYEKTNRQEQAFSAWKSAIALAKPGSDEYFAVLARYVTALEYRGQFAECERLLLDAIKQHKDKKNTGMIGLLGRMAYIGLRRNLIDQLLEYADRAYELAKEIGKEDTLFVLNLLGAKNHMVGKYEEARTFLEQASQVALKKKRFQDLMRFKSNLTIINFQLGRVDQALQNAAEAETFMRRYADFHSLTHLYLTLGYETSRRIGCSTAMEYLQKGLEYARIAGSSMMEYSIISRMAIVLMSRLDTESAIEYSKQADRLSESGQMEQTIFPTLVRAMAYSLSGDIVGGLKSVQEALAQALSGKEANIILSARENTCNIAMMAGDCRLALEQIRNIEDLLESALFERRFGARMISAKFWGQAGQNDRVLEIMDYVASEPEIAKSDFYRGSIMVLAARLATARRRYVEAEKALRAAGHLNSMDRDAGTYIELCSTQVELELARKDAEAAMEKLKYLEVAVSELPSGSIFYSLMVQRARARVLLITGDKEAAYSASIESIEKARKAGYRPLELDFVKIAAGASDDPEEIDKLSGCAEVLASEMAEPFEKSMRDVVSKHFLSTAL